MKRATGQLRIIGGEFRSRLVEFEAAPGVRATPDRVRQTLFDWLTPMIENARCLDLFAGSGALGLEALSRGAAHVTFVETGAAQAAGIRAALAKLGVADRGTVVTGDALGFLSRAPEQAFDVAFLDPPFDAGLLAPALAALPRVLKQGAQVYAEWHPRLFLNKVFGQQGNLFGIFKNWGLAGEVNVGPAFYAYLGGVGFDLALPQSYTVSCNFYYRYDKFDTHVWQISPSWVIPFSVGPVPLLFTGFVDIAGTKDLNGDNAIDLLAEPELLVDVLGLFGGKGNRLYAGVEWIFHKYPTGFAHGGVHEAHTVSAPQAMVQWTFN